jgi:hypothetical protein
MASAQTEELAQRATKLYEETLREQLERTNLNDFVAIEPDSGDYFFGTTLSEAIQASRSAHPDRLAFGIRVGHTAAVHIGEMYS